MSNKTTSGGGIGLGCVAFILFLVFLVLKLTGVIAWSWWIVCLPLIVYGAVLLLCIAIVIIVAIILLIIAWIASKID